MIYQKVCVNLCVNQNINQFYAQIMAKETKSAVSFYLESRTDKNGDAPIRVSISIRGARVVTSTGYSIAPEKWDKVNQCVKRGCSNSKGETFTMINARIVKIGAYFDDMEAETKKNKAVVTKEDIQTIWSEKFKIGKTPTRATSTTTPKTLLDCFDEFVKTQGSLNSWAVSTVARWGYIRKHITNYKQDPVFGDFDRKGLQLYMDFLREQKNLRNTTIQKNLSFVKWFLRWAKDEGYNKSDDFKAFRPSIKSAEKRVIFLDWDELMTVYNFEIPENKAYLARVRDVFCFCCFTSLRYSDAYNLKRSDIVGDMLRITTVKTSDSIEIELNDYSREILAKYEQIPYEGGKALPVISNQRMNDYLKELGEMCGIDTPQTVIYFRGSERIEEVYPKYELLGTHAGRRTFICNALALGIPADVVMKWTGHSDYKAMKPYIDIANKIKAEQMSKFNRK